MTQRLPVILLPPLLCLDRAAPPLRDHAGGRGKLSSVLALEMTSLHIIVHLLLPPPHEQAAPPLREVHKGSTPSPAPLRYQGRHHPTVLSPFYLFFVMQGKSVSAKVPVHGALVITGGCVHRRECCFVWLLHLRIIIIEITGVECGSAMFFFFCTSLSLSFIIHFPFPQ